MAEQQDQQDKKFQVVDRRCFDSEGNVRADDAKQPEMVAAVGNPSAGAAAGSKSFTQQQPGPEATAGNGHGGEEAAGGGQFQMQPGEEGEGEVSFTSFVMSLATQTLVQLGEMDAPHGMEIPVDTESARQTIDIIQMLQRKTRGNLSGDESRFIEEILHTLRMSYVRRSR